MKNSRGMIRAIALLICLVMIGTLLPVAASADLPAPQLTGAVANGSGIRVSWNAVSGADGYRVYRKTQGGSWTAIGNSSGTSYQDNTAAELTTYTYTVRAMAGGSIVSGYNSTGVSAAWNKSSAGYTTTPKLISVTAEAKGIRVKWQKSSGADGYRIYRKTTGSWQKVADVGNVDNWLNNSGVASGTKYFYTVRALIGGAVRSDYDKKGLSATWTSGLKPGEIPAPKLIAAVAEGTGLRVSWNAVDGAAAYRVYRKTGKENWKTLVEVTGTSYLDNATNPGDVYFYTVRCLNAAGEQISSYDKTGVKGSWTAPTPGNLATPILKSIKSSVGGVTLTWAAVPSASGYRVYRKTATTGWKSLGDTTGTTYMDGTAAGGQTYFYTVRAKDSSGAIASDYDKAGLSILFYATPKLVSAESIASGVQVTWKASAGAPLYLVYRKTGSGSWTRVAYVTGTSWVDKSVYEGTQYTYTVRVIQGDRKTFLSDYDHVGISCVFTGKSSISSLTNEIGGVRVKWVAVTGAASYQVLRKTGEGSWVELATVTGTNYLDTEAVNNTTHTYRVRAKNSAGDYIGSDDTNGVSKTYYVAPTLTDCVRSGDGLLTTWEAVEGISNYNVYRRYGVGNWEHMGIASGTSYLDTTPPSGTVCWYTVACADANGNSLSAYDPTGVNETSYMDQPVLSAAVNNNGTITVSWNAVDLATNYRVWRKTGDKTSWDIVQSNTTSLNWTDSDVLKGKTYYYTVSIIDPGTLEELSEFNSTGVKAAYYDPPTLTKCVNGKTGVDLEWTAVDYVGTYNVYRKTGNDVDWVLIGTKTGTTYTDTNVTSNAHYTYAIRSTVGGAVASAVSNTKDIYYYAAPKMTGISNGNGSITVTWAQEAGISTYRVYRSTNGGSTWTNMADVSATSWTDTSANSAGTKYSYAVVCVKSGSEVSAKNDPKTITYVAPVTNVKAVNATSGGVHKAKITWTTAVGMDGYDVYRRTVNTGWTKVGTVTGGTMTNSTPSEGTYFYYVVAIKNGSPSAASAQVSVTVK